MTIKSVINPSVVGDNVIEIVPPFMRRNSDGKPILDEHGLPQFDHANAGSFWAERNVPIKYRFFREYLLSAKPTYIAVFIALAKTCDYSQIRARVDKSHNLVTSSAGNAIVEMKRHGNRTVTRTYEQIAKDACVHPDTARKAIKYWLAESAIKEIDVNDATAKKASRMAGRPIKTVRFEMNPDYVWNGHLVEGICYGLSGKYG